MFLLLSFRSIFKEHYFLIIINLAKLPLCKYSHLLIYLSCCPLTLAVCKVLILMHIKMALKARKTNNSTNVCWDGMNYKQAEIRKPFPPWLSYPAVIFCKSLQHDSVFESLQIMGVFWQRHALQGILYVSCCYCSWVLDYAFEWWTTAATSFWETIRQTCTTVSSCTCLDAHPSLHILPSKFL